ncbi:GL20054 [Drosophila persimilis]|uniref:Odorant receptor n=1 Tax=Drosophila persimilis TaxID=7234 RepID=B4H8B4_DROPE|nr:odorant receptor 42b [Drosophila persimilis]EDW34949.1 GL20054 [Drosophila persimilis]
MVFKLIRPAPLTEKVGSRDGCIYLFRAMKFIGWVPPKSGVVRYVYLFWTLMTFVWSTTYLPLGFLGSYMTQIKSFSPGEFLTSLQVCFNAYGSSVKTAITYSQLWRLIKAKDLLDKLDLRCTSVEEREKIHRVVALSNHAFLIFTFVYCTYAGSTYLSSVLSGRPPWQLYNPYIDWRDGRGNLWLASTLEYVVMSGAVLQDQLSDTYPLVYTLILRVHLDMLRERIQRLRTDEAMSEAENYEELVNCILDHKIIILFCETIKPVISGTIFTQFLLCGIVLGLTLINVFFFSDLWTGIASFMFVITILLQTFPFCYTCNLIMEDCDALTHAIFQSKWVDASRRYKMTLLYFLQNVQRPIVFIAGGIFQISMSSNISVAKFAFSVITITKQMNIADKFKDE